MRALQLIYSFFLGLAVAAFVGIGVETFYPRPKADFDYPKATAPSLEQIETYEAQSKAHAQLVDAWTLNTSIILLVVATVILVVALVLPERLVVLSNGTLLGGLFTLFYAVVNSWSTSQNVLRFSVIAVSLAVTVGVGWLKFRRDAAAVPAPAAAAPGSPGDATSPGDPPLERRVAELEKRLDALRTALDD